ncbi:TlpA disulfide reductase family protein [Brumicola pallidula]|jgi:peroxiredoxin|uniref:Thiol-disulfide oxidoreductase resA n=1 Tax=Brumicola pallidula DSM 14239 = ACAM 615 TaxID=1121922 RepID=K6ZIK8_9ALTE|nr:TlpA disulfide reductase family protein [Glaciecola pallidula]GAC30202.1 thiol-disulfide oxidoreductase resA [Glaciecola pallidula DSM 14239 = ACAM 615]
MTNINIALATLLFVKPLSTVRMRQLLTNGAVVVALTICSAGAMAKPVSGEESPDFTLKSRDGGNIRLSEQRGNIVLVNFWASWCGPCREELPAFEALYQEYQDLGVEILAVNVDDEADKANVLLQDIEVSFPVLFDTSGEVSQLYDVSAMPTTVIVDRDGTVRLLHPGYRKGDEKKYEKAIKMLMRE